MATATEARPSGRERIGSRLNGINDVLQQRASGGPASAAPIVGRDAPGPQRQKHCFTLPPALLERFGAWKYRREDLISAAIDQLHDDLHDRKLPRPQYPVLPETGRSVQRVSIRMHRTTFSQLQRLARRNGWSISGTLTCLMHHFELPDYWRDAVDEPA